MESIALIDTSMSAIAWLQKPFRLFSQPNCSSWITSRLPVIPAGIMRSGYWAQQVKVGLATGARIDDGGKVAGIIEGIPGVI
jgi:hypothetical protein